MLQCARGVALAGAIAALTGLPACTSAPHTVAPASTSAAPSSVPDLSGMAWVEGDRFLAVHDAKSSDDRARVSLIELPKLMGEGLASRPIEVSWPASTGPASDLEAIARIPGTSAFLLVESGSASLAGVPLQRIFLAEYGGGRLEAVDVIDWPAPVENVEGVAVARVGNQLVFLYAERAEGWRASALRWAPLRLQPLALGSFQEASFEPADPSGRHARPVSAIELDDSGNIYVASAVDPGDDEGPFRSVIWRAGRIKADASGTAKVVVDRTPLRLASLDGLKVEAIAVREPAGGTPEIFVGTDDENYGGIVRLLPKGEAVPPRK